MLRFYAENFVDLVRRYSMLRSVITTAFENTDTPDSLIQEDSKKNLTEDFTEFRAICEQIGLDLSVMQIDRLIKRINEPDCLVSVFPKEMKELEHRILDELSLRIFMVIPSEKVHFHEIQNLFGDKVFNTFPSANFDIEEAGKCFATGRFTACVMHLQRILEVGLKAYGTLLGIASLATSAQPSWNRVLDETRKEIKERNDKLITIKTWASNEEKEFCEGVQPFLESVKIAWRNPSMHADKKYTEEIAEDVFNAVKRFMKHLAEHLDETGVFTS